jgi:hypothetical protein
VCGHRDHGLSGCRESTKTITAVQLTDALTEHFIDRNMGMPGPRQERMAADVWFRLQGRE